MSERLDYPSSEVSNRSYYKLFVGCISYDATEEELLPIFSSFGDIVEFTIQRDREGRSRGCAWLKYTTHDSCENCIAALSNKFYVNGMKSPIVVKYANTQDDDVTSTSGQTSGSATRLFVGGYPVTASDEEIIQSLSMFGEVSDFNRLSRLGVPTGPVFVTFADRTSAQALLNANGATIFMTTSTSIEIPIVLRVSAAFSPVHGASVATGGASASSLAAPGSVTSRGSSNSPIHYVNSPRSTSTSPAPSSIPTGGGKLFVGCLPYSRTSTDLADLFSQYGPLVEVALLTTPDGKSKGAAFVTYVERTDAERALAELQGYTFPNSSRGINISFATKQTRPGGTPLISRSNTSAMSRTNTSTNDSLSRYSSITTSSPRIFQNAPTLVSTPEHPITPPGFAAVASHPLLTPYTSFSPPSAGPVHTPSDEILKYIQSRHNASAESSTSPTSYSILRKTSDLASADLDRINEAMLKSLFETTDSAAASAASTQNKTVNKL